MIFSRKLSIVLLCLYFSYNSLANSLLDSVKVKQKIESAILLNTKDSAIYYLKHLKKSKYKDILTKICLNKNLSYGELDYFLTKVTMNPSFKYKFINDFINQEVSTPENNKKVDLDYVNIKWVQISKLRNEISLDSANQVFKEVESYLNQFSEDDEDVVVARLKMSTHNIVMHLIRRDLKGKKICLENLEKARKIENIPLQITFLYHLSDFYTFERKLLKFIEVCEEALFLGRSINKESNYYYSIVEYLIDGYIFKGNEEEKVLDLLEELYEDEDASSRILSYNYYLKLINKSDNESPIVGIVLDKFEAKDIDDLVVKFKKFVQPLNQLDYSKFLRSSSNTLIKFGYINKGISFKNEEIELVKSIYSKDLSETLSDYKTEQALKTKEIEIQNQKKIKRVYLSISLLLSIFFVIALIIIRKIRKQRKELKLKNQFISKTLKEKELLVKEVHHRVKNNFQIVSSLLELQTKDIEDHKALALAKEGKNRVNSMAIIHQKLYQNETGLIDFDEYLNLLVNELNILYASNYKIHTSIVSENMKFDVDTAIPLGLIINEIITNSYKYAFKADKENKLLITIDKKSNEDFILMIEDNGPGIPDNIEVKKAKSLGLRLINRLVKQLHGTIDVITEEGTRFVILFKDENARKLIN